MLLVIEGRFAPSTIHELPQQSTRSNQSERYAKHTPEALLHLFAIECDRFSIETILSNLCKPVLIEFCVPLREGEKEQHEEREDSTNPKFGHDGPIEDGFVRTQSHQKGCQSDDVNRIGKHDDDADWKRPPFIETPCHDDEENQ